MSVYNVVSLSGGKDSTAMLLMMLERGMRVDEVVSADTGMEFPAMDKHLRRVEEYTESRSRCCDTRRDLNTSCSTMCA